MVRFSRLGETIGPAGWSKSAVTESERGDLELRSERSWFDAFVEDHGAGLRRALVAAYGVQVGNDACADALAWAWEHRASVMAMDSPVSYLFRVAQSAARRHIRWRREVLFPPEVREEVVPVGSVRLDDALGRLSQRQRTVVVLVHAHGWSYGEVAKALGVSLASVRNQLHRGMKRLRDEMEAS
jgi:RNA polymerase sigma factor (sigma-70 family)